MSSLVSLVAVRSIKGFRSAKAPTIASCQPTTLLAEGSNRLAPSRSTILWTSYHCCRCISSSKSLLTDKPPPLVTPKVSKYRIDSNSPKAIKRKKTVKHALKAIPNIVRGKPVANPRIARQKAEAATREIMKAMKQAEAAKESTVSSTSSTDSSSLPNKSPTALKPKRSSPVSTAKPTKTVSSTPEPATKESTFVSAGQQSLPKLNLFVSQIAKSTVSQSIPASPEWNTTSPRQPYRLPPPELTDRPEDGHTTLESLPRLASTIEHRPSQAPQRIKRSVYRTILDWSVHPTVQPNDFNDLVDLPQSRLSRIGLIKETPVNTSIKPEKLNPILATATDTTSSTTTSYPDEPFTNKRYKSRRKIGFDDDLDLDANAREPRTNDSKKGWEHQSKKAIAPASFQHTPPSSQPKHLSTTEVLDAIVQDRISEQGSGNKPNPWGVSGIVKQNILSGDRKTLLKRPVIDRLGHSDITQKTTMETMPTRSSEPLLSTTSELLSSTTSELLSSTTSDDLLKPLPQSFLSTIYNAEEIPGLVLPKRNLLGTWEETDYIMYNFKTQTTPTPGKTIPSEYVFTPKSVLPALKTGLRVPVKLYYSDSATDPKYSRFSGLTQECVDTAKDMGLDIVRTNSRELDKLLGHDYHQGILLRASYLPKATIQYMGAVSAEDGTYNVHFARGPEKMIGQMEINDDKDKKQFSNSVVSRAPSPLWILLDELHTIYDTGNIIKLAYQLGVDGVLIKEKDGINPSGDVSAVSEGTLERRPVYGVKALTKFFRESKANGWQIVSVKPAFGSKRLNALHKFPASLTSGVTQPTVLILGGDGSRPSKISDRQSDQYIHVPEMTPFKTSVTSLSLPELSSIVLSKLLGDRLVVTGRTSTKNRTTERQRQRDGDSQPDSDTLPASFLPWRAGRPEWEEISPKKLGSLITWSHNRSSRKSKHRK
ncbi:hypothetical protein FBU30_005015 [Linnemannia zychae]|nr:hypothetical protein FBU30_005015 [Linnemannia zychae]